MTDRQLLDLVERLAGVRVLVAGDAILDHYVVGRVERISPEAPVPVVRVAREFDRVGGAANVAANLAALGGTARLVALVGGTEAGGPDADAERLAERCAALGIEATLIPALARTARKTRILSARQQLLRIDWEGTGAADADAPPPLPERILHERRTALEAGLADCDAVLVSDYAKGGVDAELVGQCLRSGKPVVVDPRPRNAALYRGVTLVTPNRREAHAMLELPDHRTLPPETLASRIAETLGTDALVTLGEDGMCLAVRDRAPETIATRAREVFDVTGAGDTVAATMALALGAGLDPLEGAHLANAAAGAVVAHVGAAHVTPEELRAALTRQE